MPELPEVETIKRSLQKSLVGQQISSVDVRHSKIFIGDAAKLKNQTITEISRHSKILIIALSDGVILIHLKMTGQLIFLPKEGDAVIGGHPDKLYGMDLPHKHTHVIFNLTGGTLFFNDLRKFGWVKLYPSLGAAKLEFAQLGVEYTWPEYSVEYLTNRLERRKNTSIKQALLDQAVVAGIGNIYADETLFCAKIHPSRKVKDITSAEVKKMFECIPKVFELSLKHGGTSRQHYLLPDGSVGSYSKFAQVYNREAKPCNSCGAKIERIKIAGRSSHFCPICQR